MTHVMTYINNQYDDQQVRALIDSQKEIVCQAFSLTNDASTVVVRRMDASDVCANTANAVITIVYTAAGKGAEVKRRLTKGLKKACADTLRLGDDAKIVCVIKEQMSDMIGVNGILRANDVSACSAYESAQVEMKGGD